jgi:thioredoxin reductase
MAESWDVIIVGAGPAGLSAALVLGRCRRRVLVLDDDKPRNAVSRALHGYLTRDGIPPSEFRRIAREQVSAYDSVHFRHATVTDARSLAPGFEVTTGEGETLQSAKLLIACGVVDWVPEIAGCRELYGQAVFHCPYCDGWEVRDQPLAAYGKGDRKGAGLALELLAWSSDVVLCTDGECELTTGWRDRLSRHGIALREERIRALEEPAGGNAGVDIVFTDGSRLSRHAMFFNTGREQSSELAQKLGCEACAGPGCTVDNPFQATNVPGLYVAGDASRDVLQVVVAAAEGAAAAMGMNNELVKERFP